MESVALTVEHDIRPLGLDSTGCPIAEINGGQYFQVRQYVDWVVNLYHHGRPALASVLFERFCAENERFIIDVPRSVLRRGGRYCLVSEKPRLIRFCHKGEVVDQAKLDAATYVKSAKAKSIIRKHIMSLPTDTYSANEIPLVNRPDWRQFKVKRVDGKTGEERQFEMAVKGRSEYYFRVKPMLGIFNPAYDSRKLKSFVPTGSSPPWVYTHYPPTRPSISVLEENVDAFVKLMDVDAKKEAECREIIRRCFEAVRNCQGLVVPRAYSSTPSGSRDDEVIDALSTLSLDMPAKPAPVVAPLAEPEPAVEVIPDALEEVAAAPAAPAPTQEESLLKVMKKLTAGLPARFDTIMDALATVVQKVDAQNETIEALRDQIKELEHNQKNSTFELRRIVPAPRVADPLVQEAIASGKLDPTLFKN